MAKINVYHRAFIDYRKETVRDKTCSVDRKNLRKIDANFDVLKSKKYKCTIDEEWIIKIEEGLVFVEKAVAEERQFIRVNGDYDTICRSFDTGVIQQFYPPLGANPNRKFYFLIPVGAAVLGVVLAILFFPKQVYNGKRGNLEALALTAVEKESPQEKDLSSQSFNYILTSKEIEKCYKDAIGYFQSHNDNLAQKEINKLLNSNAAFSIKQKCQVLMSYLEIPTFDTLKDNFSYSEVSKEPMLYLDCWVSWDGRISNSIVNADGSYTCQLLVGYETMKNVDGIVTVYFEREPSILPDQAVKILGKIDYQDENIVLNGRAVYQSVKK